MLLNHLVRVIAGGDTPDWILSPGMDICWNLVRKALNGYMKYSSEGGLTCPSLWNETKDVLQQRIGQCK